MTNGPYTGPLTVIRVQKHKNTRGRLPRPAHRGGVRAVELTKV